MSALSSRLYFIYNSDVQDEIITNRIMPPVHDSISNYTGTINILTGLKIENLRTDSTIDAATTKTYAIRQIGVNDENRYQGPTYHVNNVGIGTTPEYNYNQGARLRVFSDDYTLPNTGQSSVTSTIISMKMATASSGSYNVGRVVSSLTSLELGFAGVANAAPGSQSLNSGNHWSASFSYLRFTTPRTVTASATTIASASAAQCNFVTNTIYVTGCTSVSNIVTCTSTANLHVGAVLTITAGSGAFSGTTTVTAVTSLTSFTLSAIPSLALSGPATLKAQIDGNMSGTIATYRAMSPIADVALGYNGTITNSIGILVEDQDLIGSGTITNKYGIVQGSISSSTAGQGDVNIINAEVTIFNNLPVYANEAAAVTGGLATGTIYQTATGELRIKL